jgi:magnesium transporter
LMRHIISPHSEILTELQSATMKFYKWDLDVYFEDLLYKTDKILSLVSIAHENTESLFDVSDTLTTIRTNKIISILTIFTVLLWILTRISGLYWMNVARPAQNFVGVFWRLLWGMIWLTIWSMVYFKWKKLF